MIINTGMRTDIPAFYSTWFYQRIKEGYVLTRNPYYPQQVTRYRLTPDVVDCLAFCTKNPEPMLGRLEELAAFRQFWFVTITPYGRDIEPLVPGVEQVIDGVKRLSQKLEPQALSWRYDPIFLTDTYTMDFHLSSMERMAAALSGYVDSCVISFIDLYAKTRKNFPLAREVTKEEQAVLGREFASIGKKYNIAIRSCCEGTHLAQYGVEVTGCMTRQILERAIGGGLTIPGRDRSPREKCGCVLGHDIGMYNTCPHGCIYCYANEDREQVKKNYGCHDPASPFLIGTGHHEDIIKEARQESYIDGQLSLCFT